MATLLLDTSVIIDAINNKKGRRQLLRDLVNQGNSLACCPINITEVYAGLRPHEEASTKALLSSLDLFPMTRPIAELAGLLKRDYSKKGQTLNLGDVMIAATALHNGVALLTDNTKDFPMKELRLYSLPN
jgi:predicted nucleic acid-binding protein